MTSPQCGLLCRPDERLRVLEAIQAGASNYLVKPFEAEMLMDKLQKYIAVEA